MTVASAVEIAVTAVRIAQAAPRASNAVRIAAQNVAVTGLRIVPTNRKQLRLQAVNRQQPLLPTPSIPWPETRRRSLTTSEPPPAAPARKLTTASTIARHQTALRAKEIAVPRAKAEALRVANAAQAGQLGRAALNADTVVAIANRTLAVAAPASATAARHMATSVQAATALLTGIVVRAPTLRPAGLSVRTATGSLLVPNAAKAVLIRPARHAQRPAALTAPVLMHLVLHKHHARLKPAPQKAAARIRRARMKHAN